METEIEFSSHHTLASTLLVSTRPCCEEKHGEGVIRAGWGAGGGRGVKEGPTRRAAPHCSEQ